MTYDDFKRLVLLFGGGIILTTTVLVATVYKNPEEAVGQLLFIIILLSIVYYGRRGGWVSAIITSLVYSIVIIPVFMENGVINTLPLLALRILIYFVTAIMGGEICVRIRHMLTALEGRGVTDAETRLYKPAHFACMINSQIQMYERYESIFSLINIKIEKQLLDGMTHDKKRRLLRKLGATVRQDLRMTDEAGRLDDHTISALLPHTPKDGGEACAKRLFTKACRIMGNEDDLTYEVVTYPDDKERMEDFVNRYPESVPAGA